MGAALSWPQGGFENWVLAKDTHFLRGAIKVAATGSQEVIPLKEVQEASNFAAQWAGQIVSLGAIPTEAVLGPIDLDQTLETPS